MKKTIVLTLAAVMFAAGATACGSYSHDYYDDPGTDFPGVLVGRTAAGIDYFNLPGERSFFIDPWALTFQVRHNTPAVQQVVQLPGGGGYVLLEKDGQTMRRVLPGVSEAVRLGSFVNTMLVSPDGRYCAAWFDVASELQPQVSVATNNMFIIDLAAAPPAAVPYQLDRAVGRVLFNPAPELYGAGVTAVTNMVAVTQEDRVAIILLDREAATVKIPLRTEDDQSQDIPQVVDMAFAGYIDDEGELVEKLLVAVSNMGETMIVRNLGDSPSINLVGSFGAVRDLIVFGAGSGVAIRPSSNSKSLGLVDVATETFELYEMSGSTYELVPAGDGLMAAFVDSTETNVEFVFVDEHGDFDSAIEPVNQRVRSVLVAPDGRTALLTHDNAAIGGDPYTAPEDDYGYYDYKLARVSPAQGVLTDSAQLTIVNLVERTVTPLLGAEGERRAIYFSPDGNKLLEHYLTQNRFALRDWANTNLVDDQLPGVPQQITVVDADTFCAIGSSSFGKVFCYHLDVATGVGNWLTANNIFTDSILR